MIYADNAATTSLDLEAFEAMKPFLLSEYGNASQPYSFSRTAKKALIQSREVIASCINARPEEIFFTSGGTESDNWALKGTILAGGVSGNILTSIIEHHAVLNSCAAVERQGFPVSYLPVDNSGIVLSEKLKQNISEMTLIVSIMHANNEIGTIQPIKNLCQITHSNGAIFHTDAVQTIGHIPVDVKDLEVDLLSASAHKFNGPKGVGFLFVKNGTQLYSYVDGGAQEHGMRAGTENIAGIVSMATALKKNCDFMDKNKLKMQRLENDLLHELKSYNIDFIRNGTDKGIPGNISLSFKGKQGEVLLHRLDLMGICVSTGSACDSHNMKISHVLNAIKLEREYALGTIRISFGPNNHDEDGYLIAKAIEKIIR